MKKLITLLLGIAVTLLVWGFFVPANAQDSAKEEKPTFYRLVPGVYVNGYPRFTVRYPKDWVERRGFFVGGEVLRVSPPGPAQSRLCSVIVAPGRYPLDKFADIIVQVFKTMGFTDVTIVSNKPSRLLDGTPAQEVEFKMVANGEPYNVVTLAPKGDFLIYVGVATNSPKIGEDLKAIIYSLEFQQGKDELVKVPADIQAFLDNLRIAWVSHDLAKLMTHYSDRYLNSGVRKGEMERVQRQRIGFTTSVEIFITEFIPADDRAHLTGFVTINGLKSPLTNISIIKENGEWKWYGNQRDVSP